MPWILQEAYLQGDVHPETLVLHRGSGAVVFSDASGFTALTERLALKTNGAELLSQCLTSFFTPLIQSLSSSTWGGARGNTGESRITAHMLVHHGLSMAE